VRSFTRFVAHSVPVAMYHFRNSSSAPARASRRRVKRRLVSYHVYPHDMALLAITVPLLAYSARSTGWTPVLALLASTDFALLLVPFIWHAERQRSEGYAVLLVAVLVQTCAAIICGRRSEMGGLALRGVGRIHSSPSFP
jgi:hypothetical protein